MRRYLMVFIAFWILASCLRSHSSASEKEWIIDSRDRVIVEQVLEELGDGRDLPIGELMVKVGCFFLETPYEAGTLEKGDSEKLVINVRELDCTTFAENCLALARTLRLKNPDFNDFAGQLELIRYRGGVRNGYPSRLHYFSDWIFDNDRKGLVKEISQEIAHIMVPNRVNFMSTHPDSYEALKNNPGHLEEIKQQEVEISNRMTWYIPKNMVAGVGDALHDGDIIGITTGIEGLDVSHVAIVMKADGVTRFIHASSKENKVVISSGTLEKYLLGSNLATGIMVARPL